MMVVVVIERLFICQRLRTLILSNNSIKEIQNVDCCRQLWNLDISGNKVSTLKNVGKDEERCYLSYLSLRLNSSSDIVSYVFPLKFTSTKFYST